MENKNMPDLNTDLLLSHLEYSDWAVNKTFVMIDKLPPDAITNPICSSFPSILETLQHIYQWNQYYFMRLSGRSIELNEIILPATYPELKEEMHKLITVIIEWANDNLPDKKNKLLYGWATWPVWMVIMQIANHCTHHLGQLLTLIRQAGYTPTQNDWTDLILYYLNRFPVNCNAPTQNVSTEAAT